MAIAKQKSIHRWEGKKIEQTLFEVIHYALNQEKTTYTNKSGEEKILAAAYGCGKSPSEAAAEWIATKNLYTRQTGRSQGKHDVLAYRIIQSFDPSDNIDPELANKIGCELAMKLTGGGFSFVVGTHVDKEHTHNHIVINSTNLEATYKFRDVKRSFERVLKKLNDEICRKHNLSVIKERKAEDMSEVEKTKYINWLNRNNDKREAPEDNGTWRNILRQVIDIILGRKSDFSPLEKKVRQAFEEKIREASGNSSLDFPNFRPKDFAEFVKLLEACGYEIKGLEHKYISVRAEGQKKFTRLNPKTLGEAYTRNRITEFIEQYSSPISRPSSKIEVENSLMPEPKLNRIIDVKNNAKVQANVGYERWAKLQNLKTLADTHSHMAANDLTFDDVKMMVSEKEAEIATLESQKNLIEQYSERQKEISVLQNHLINYVKNRKVFDEYKKSGYSKTFKAENAETLEAYSCARKYFDEYKAAHGAAKLPTMQELRSENAELKAKKSDFYDELKARREELKLLKNLKLNAMELLGVNENGDTTKAEKEIKRERSELIKIQNERLAKERTFKNRKR